MSWADVTSQASVLTLRQTARQDWADKPPRLRQSGRTQGDTVLYVAW